MITAKLYNSKDLRKYDTVTISDISESDSKFIKNVKIQIHAYYDKYVQNCIVLVFTYINEDGDSKTLTSYSRGRTIKKTISDAVDIIKGKDLLYYLPQ